MTAHMAHGTAVRRHIFARIRVIAERRLHAQQMKRSRQHYKQKQYLNATFLHIERKITYFPRKNKKYRKGKGKSPLNIEELEKVTEAMSKNHLDGRNAHGRPEPRLFYIYTPTMM